MNSNRHGSYKLGYSCATMVFTKGCKNVNWSESLKITLVWIAGCNLPAWNRNR